MPSLSIRTGLCLLAAGVLVSGGRAEAQRLPAEPAWATTHAATPLPAVPAVPTAAREGRKRGALRTALHGVGGAVVGAWVGYVASQVARSDWEKESNTEFVAYRRRYAGAGAGAGTLLGLWVGGRTGSPPVPRLVEERWNPGAPIGREEIERSGAANAHDVVQSLRPVWLRTRGLSKLDELTTVEGDLEVRVRQGAPTIRVYLDGVQVGGAEALRQIAAPAVASIGFLSATAATMRWGAGHDHGAIVVSSLQQ